MTDNDKLLLGRLREALAGADSEPLEALVDDLAGPELMRVVLRLKEDEQLTLLRRLSNEAAADLLDEVPEAYAADLVEHMRTEDAAAIVLEMEQRDGLDLLQSVALEERAEIVGAMPAHLADRARTMLSYGPDTAGGMMVAGDYLGLHLATPVDSAIRVMLRRQSDLPPAIAAQAFVVDGDGRLFGIARPPVLAGALSGPVSEVAERCAAVHVSAELELLHGIFETTHDLALAVTADDGLLLGVLTREAVDAAFAERLTEDHLKSQGIISEELRTMPVLQRSRRRLSWLTVNIGLNMVAASVIAAYEDTLTAVIALAVFLPVVSDMSGCSGNQAVAVSMRELTLGVARPQDVLRVWWQEAKVGVLNGICLGVLLGFVAFLWKGNVALGIVVGSALTLNTLVAVSIGGTVPLLLRRFGVDPAVASGPLLTTVTDMCGFFLVLGIATQALPWL